MLPEQKITDKCLVEVVWYLSASSPSSVMTAESARVMAGALKNSPITTSSSSRKNVFWISGVRYTMYECRGVTQSLCVSGLNVVNC